MPLSEVEIMMTGHGRGTVKVGGTEIQNVRAIRFESSAGGVSLVTLEVIARTVRISGPVSLETKEIDVTAITSPAREYERKGG